MNVYKANAAILDNSNVYFVTNGYFMGTTPAISVASTKIQHSLFIIYEHRLGMFMIGSKMLL